MLYNLLPDSSKFNFPASVGALAKKKNNSYSYPWIASFIFLRRDGVSLDPFRISRRLLVSGLMS